MQKEFEEEKVKGIVGICLKERFDVEFMVLDFVFFNLVENFIEIFKFKEIKFYLLFCNVGIVMYLLGMLIQYIFVCCCDI